MAVRRAAGEGCVSAVNKPGATTCQIFVARCEEEDMYLGHQPQIRRPPTEATRPCTQDGEFSVNQKSYFASLTIAFHPEQQGYTQSPDGQTILLAFKTTLTCECPASLSKVSPTSWARLFSLESEPLAGI
jgi:hypothetical protein